MHTLPLKFDKSRQATHLATQVEAQSRAPHAVRHQSPQFLVQQRALANHSIAAPIAAISTTVATARWFGITSSIAQARGWFRNTIVRLTI